MNRSKFAGRLLLIILAGLSANPLEVAGFLSDTEPLPGAIIAADSKKTANSAARESLKPLNCLIGEWRGVGQPRRGSRQGAWTEKTTFSWSFTQTSPAIVAESENSQLFQSLSLKWDQVGQQVILEECNGQHITSYTGKFPEAWPGPLELTSPTDAAGEARRCIIRPLTDIRLTVLFEKQSSPESSFRRIAEIGYTRAGEKLAVDGANQRKCIVTGGLGTIPVSYEGKTYYVCCQGCVQAFNDAPAAIIADYEASLKTK